MKKSLLILFMATFGLAMTAQIIELQIDTITCDPPDAPDGYCTVQLKAIMTNATDVITTVYGSLEDPLSISTDCCFWQAPAGGTSSYESNFALCGFIPGICYDSFVTIGNTPQDQNPDGSLFMLGNWAAGFNAPCDGVTTHNNILIDDIIGGAWFTTPGSSNSIAGADLCIVLGQFTTCGSLCVNINVQVFPNYTGPGSSDIYQEGLGICTLGEQGCLDPLACNFNPNAVIDDLTCVYPCDLTYDSELHENPTCSFDQDGEIHIETTGGQGYVRYYIDGTGNNEDTDNLTGNFTGLPNGTYTMTVVDECFLPGAPCALACGVVGCEQEIQIVLNTTPLTLSSGINMNVSCNGLLDGSSTYSFAGGTGDITFTPYDCATDQPIEDGNGDPIELSTPSYTGFSNGSFQWQAIDENNCTFEFSCFTLTQPADLNVTIQNTYASTCSNTPDGGVALNWFGGVGDVDFTFWADSADAGNYYEGNFFLDMFTPGTYNVYGTDVNGCEDIDTFIITGPSAVVVSATDGITSCSYLDDGCVTGSATGGNLGTYTYSLDDVNYMSAAQFCNLEPGDYTVYAHDSQGCGGSTIGSVSAPSALVGSANTIDVTCNGYNNGQIDVTATGATPTYFYSIDGAPNTINGLFTGQLPGDHTIIVSDLNDCMDTVTVTIDEPAVLLLSGGSTSALCFGSDDGTITVSASGGTGDYTYQLDNDPEQSATLFGGLDADEYTITVTDENGCEAETDVEVTEPSQLTATLIDKTNETIADANDGTISISANGGTTPYTYEWYNQGGDLISTDEDPTDLAPGFYTVIVTDANGCEYDLGSYIEIEPGIIGVAEIAGGIVISLNPNPTLGNFAMNLEGLNGEKVSYRIMDMQGRVVVSRELGTQSGTRTEWVDITTHAAGIYYMNVIIGEQQATLKVVKN